MLPTTQHLVGGLHDQPRSPGGVLSRSARDGLVHTSLTLGKPRARHLGNKQGISHPAKPVQHQMYAASMDRFGTSLLSPMGAVCVSDSRVRGRLTTAGMSGAFWATYTTMTCATMRKKRTALKLSTGNSAVVRRPSDALLPTGKRVGFRATHL